MRIEDLDGHAGYGCAVFVEQIDFVLSGLLIRGHGHEAEGCAVLEERGGWCGRSFARLPRRRGRGREGIALLDGSRQFDICAQAAHTKNVQIQRTLTGYLSLTALG